MRQIEVINLETIIDVTAETSNVEILVQDYDAELVERFALEAQEAAIDAEESADIATAQASIATAQATIATNQAGIATTQAGIATTQTGIATTKANEASASAASALASEQAADADRIAAQAAASTATTQAGIATTQAGIATTKAGEASASAAAALASETDAETAASTATTQAGIATTQAGIATTQAGIATTQAGNALTSANNAAASAAAAAQVGTSTLLTGFSTGANSTILATDTILQGFNKTQGQINARVSGTIATGQVAFGTAANTVGGDSGLVWNNTVKRLELLGTDNSTIRLRGNTAGAGYFVTQINSNSTAIALGNSGVITGTGTSNILWSNTDLDIFISNTQRARFFSANGNLLLQSGGTFTDAGFRLDVNGTARVQGVLTATADAVVNGVNVGIGGGSISTNTRVGSFALNANTTGDLNSAFGLNALLLNTTGTNNIAFGGGALQANTTGGGNTAIGRLAGRFIADGATANTISNNSTFLGFDTRANASGQTNQIVIGHTAIGLGNNTTVIGNSSTTFGRWFGNLLVGSSTNSGQQLQVTGTSLLNGLSTIQGTTASDSGQLGAELLTTGTGDASWTGTSFATGYTHVAGSTTTLTSTLAGVVSTFYQITYTVTGRTAGNFTIGFGGFTSGNLTATGAVGPQATTTGTLVITPTSDFNGTIVLSIRVISASSASVTFNSSAGTVTNQIRISSNNSNTFFGRAAAQNNTTGNSNSFFGVSAGRDNTTGGSNSFFGLSAGTSNTIGSNNSFFGQGSGQANTTGGGSSFFGQGSGFVNSTGSSNSFFGQSSGQNNTTASNNSFFGQNSGFSNTTGASNSFFGANAGFFSTTGANNCFVGFDAGRRIANGNALPLVNNSIFIGIDTRANADNQTNQIVIGHNATGLGSNTTVLGNSSTTHGRWYGSLLLGTTTNAASSILTMESTTQGFLPPRMTTTQKNAIASPATGLVVYDNTLNKLSVFTGLVWETVTSL